MHSEVSCLGLFGILMLSGMVRESTKACTHVCILNHFNVNTPFSSHWYPSTHATLIRTIVYTQTFSVRWQTHSTAHRLLLSWLTSTYQLHPMPTDYSIYNHYTLHAAIHYPMGANFRSNSLHSNSKKGIYLPGIGEHSELKNKYDFDCIQVNSDDSPPLK